MNLTEAETVHRRLLEKWRGAMNLVGPGDALHHFHDAAGAVQRLTVEGRWIDLGSGAGFPGIALAARHPKAEIHLVESRAKRVAFLRAVLQETGLPNLCIHHCRTEAMESGFDGAISRAYKPPESYLADAARLLRPGGTAVLLSGEVPPPFAGWSVVRSHTYAVGAQSRVCTVLTPR